MLTTLLTVLAMSLANAATVAQQGQQLAEHINLRDGEAITAMIDVEGLARTAIKDLELSANEQRGFIEGFVEKRDQVSNNLLAGFTGKSTAKLLRSTRVGSGYQHLLRFDFADEQGASQGFGYVRFECNGEGKITDWFDYAVGLKSSDAIGRLAAGIFGARSSIRAWFGVSQIDPKALAAFERFVHAIAEKKPSLAYEEMAGLPTMFKKTQLYATYRVMLAQQINDATYRASLEELAAHFGNEPTLQFLLIDHFFHTKRIDRAVRAIETFEDNVIKDAATSVLKCNAYLEDAKPMLALAACETAVNAEPELTLAWDSLLGVTAATNDSAVFIDVVERYEKVLVHPLNADSIADLPEYSWLKRDRRFKKWARARR
jgi:hypothetical protein